VVSLGGLGLGYDVKGDTYYVHKDVDLGPKQTSVFDVEIRDIWVIPPETLDEIRFHVDALSSKVAKTDYARTAQEARAQVVEDLEKIRKSQAENAIDRVSNPIRHIRAYEANVERLKKLKIVVGGLENLVLGTEQDVGRLLGEVEAPVQPRRAPELAADDYGSAVVSISVHNPSHDLPRTVAYFRRDLPSEIGIADVLDGGGLEVGVDAHKGSCYVYQRDLQIGPGETVTYNIQIRDKWNVNAARLTRLRASISDVAERMTEKQKYVSVSKAMDELLGKIDTVAEEVVPQELNDGYIAFYREQGDRIDLIEQKFNRIESALARFARNSKWGVKRVKPPSPKTTWMIIYIILGFLALVSLLFFFRWFGRTKAEALDAGTPPE